MSPDARFRAAVDSVTFGMLWGAVAKALISREGFWRCVIGGALAGMFFATVAVRRERRGVRGQLRRQSRRLGERPCHTTGWDLARRPSKRGRASSGVPALTPEASTRPEDRFPAEARFSIDAIRGEVVRTLRIAQT
jgi:hypothetical protein